MKKIISKALFTFIAVSALLIPGSAKAQILYKVEKPGNSRVSYILGTHHFAPLAVVDSLKSLPEALANVDVLYGELDMAKSTSPEAIVVMQKAYMAPADSTLDKVLSPAALDSLKTVWDDLTQGQVPLQMIYPMKPSAISTQIAAALAMKAFPQLNPLEGIDKTMQDRALALGKKVDGLETLDYQLNVLMGDPISEQAKGLMKMVGDINGEIENTKKLSEAYVAGDLAAMEKLMLDESEDPESMERLIFKRNDAWAKRIIPEMPEKSMMVVVGAGHLPGERGLLTQLRNAGFTVTPLN